VVAVLRLAGEPGSNHPLKTARMTDCVCAARLREQLPQVFQTGSREGEGLLVASAIDPEAAILRTHVVGRIPQELLVLAEDFRRRG
jgi:hypothetical protein